jgi:hypothetical protein
MLGLLEFIVIEKGLCLLCGNMCVVSNLGIGIFLMLKWKAFLTLKISSDQIWVAGYFGQPLTYPDFTIFSSDFLCNSLKS